MRKNYVERLVVMGEVTKGAVGMSSIFFSSKHIQMKVMNESESNKCVKIRDYKCDNLINVLISK